MLYVCGQMQKQDPYSKWLNDDYFIPFAFDSAGNIAPETAKFMNRLFAASNNDYQRICNSEKKIFFLNWFFNKLSMI